MMTLRFLLPALLGVLGYALLCDATTPLAQASVVQALSLQELTQQADEIILCEPTQQKSRRHIDGKLIVTDFSLRVYDVLKGKAQIGKSVVATVLGGKLETLALQVPGEASFVTGERALVFLYRAPTSRDLRVVGMSQGVLPLKQEGDKTLVMPGGGGAALMDRGSDGALRQAPAALTSPMPLREVLDRVRKLVRAP